MRLQYSVLFVDDNGNQGISTFSPCFSRDRERKMRWTVDVHVKVPLRKRNPQRCFACMPAVVPLCSDSMSLLSVENQ